MVQQGARREHSGEVKEQVWVELKFVGQRALEGILKGRRSRRRDRIPPLGRAKMVVVDCTDILHYLQGCTVCICALWNSRIGVKLIFDGQRAIKRHPQRLPLRMPYHSLGT